MKQEKILRERIDKLKAVLDEMCGENSEQKEEEKINLSRHLDQLICEYMKLKK